MEPPSRLAGWLARLCSKLARWFNISAHQIPTRCLIYRFRILVEPLLLAFALDVLACSVVGSQQWRGAEP
jgi:hypothetical protein